MLQRLTKSIYYLPFEEETDRPNLYYIRGEKESVAIDAGNSPAHLEKFYKALEAEELPLPSRTIITHWHWDHTFALENITGKSYGSKGTFEKLEQVKKWQWNEAAMHDREQSGEDIKFCNDCIRKEYHDLSEIKVINLDEIIEVETHWDIGGIELILYPRDSTHTRDAVFVYLPAEKCLVVSDADWLDSYDNDGKYDRVRLADMTAFFEKLDYEKHLLGHGLWKTKEEAMDYLNGISEELKTGEMV